MSHTDDWGDVYVYNCELRIGESKMKWSEIFLSRIVEIIL